MLYDIPATKRTNLVDLIGDYTQLKKSAHGEWAGPCPRCGGTDRFRVTNKGWFCRHCTGEPGANGHWKDAIDFIQFVSGVDFRTAYFKLVGQDHKADPREVARLEAERFVAQEMEALREEEERILAVEKLQKERAWERYHQGMTAPQAEMWHERGLSDEWIDYWKLGYARKVHQTPQGPYEADSLTIPYWRQGPDRDDKRTWDCISLRHRIVSDGFPGGKYRPHLHGLGNQLFYTDPDTCSLFGRVLLVEGEIKAMVTWTMMWKGDNLLTPDLFVIGTPGKNWKQEWVAQLQEVDKLYICLDPDAREPARDLAMQVGQDKCKVLDLPAKIDDLILAGALKFDSLMRLMED